MPSICPSLVDNSIWVYRHRWPFRESSQSGCSRLATDAQHDALPFHFKDLPSPCDTIQPSIEMRSQIRRCGFHDCPELKLLRLRAYVNRISTYATANGEARHLVRLAGFCFAVSSSVQHLGKADDVRASAGRLPCVIYPDLSVHDDGTAQIDIEIIPRNSPVSAKDRSRCPARSGRTRAGRRRGVFDSVPAGTHTGIPHVPSRAVIDDPGGQNP